MSIEENYVNHAIMQRAKKDSVFKQEMLDFLDNMEEAIATLRKTLEEE
tara:strand:- start:89 stop:232 length:144 start_codon:yes stop_codon:yes gene_type:complete